MSLVCADVALLEGTNAAVVMTFTNIDGAAEDPTGIAVVATAPDGTLHEWSTPDATITNTGLGEWRFTFPFGLTPGTWHVFVAGTAGVLASAETTIAVRAAGG